MPLSLTARGRDRFLSILEQTRKRYRFLVVGYVAMPEHFHLLISEPEVGTPSTVRQVLKQRTARTLLPKPRRTNPHQRLFDEEPRRAGVVGQFNVKFIRACKAKNNPPSSLIRDHNWWLKP